MTPAEAEQYIQWANTPEGIEAIHKMALESSYKKLFTLKYAKPDFPIEEWKGIYDTRKSYNWICLKDGCKFQSVFRSFKLPFQPRHEKCYPRKGSSSFQETGVEFVEQTLPEEAKVKTRVRGIIPHLEIDLVIENKGKKFLVEFDGTYWHSSFAFSSANKPLDYNKQKTDACEKLGYPIVHISDRDMESELTRNAMLRRFYAFFTDDEVYNARKCSIQDVSEEDASVFLSEYHLQGNIKSLIRLGLYYHGTLVALMTFGKPADKNYEYEAQRYCSRGRVRGGASRLYKHFLKTYHPKSVVSYADRSWSTGYKLYETLGLEHSATLPPHKNLYRTTGKDNHTKCDFVDVNVKELLGDKYNPEFSDMKNLAYNGYSEVYDCGQFVFSKIYS